jgi:serine protease Do
MKSEIHRGMCRVLPALLACCPLLLATPAKALEPDELFQKVAPSVVTVVALHDAAGRTIGFGSGVVIVPQTVVTNCHVLEKGKSILVKSGKEIRPAKLVHADVKRDLCQLSVEDLSAPAVEIGSALSLRVGQRVYAIGNPRQLELTLTDGLVSALRDIREGAPLIQTSTPISPGSSGGGLFDAQGRLIGITTWSRKESQNLNFAHPADWIAEMPQRAAEQLASYRSRPSPPLPSPPASARQEPPASPAASAAASRPADSSPEKILTANELDGLFGNNRELRISAPSGLHKLVFLGDGYVHAEFMSYGRRTGKRELRAGANQICLRFFVSNRNFNTLLAYINDCFTVSRMADRTYRFTSADRQFMMIGDL